MLIWQQAWRVVRRGWTGATASANRTFDEQPQFLPHHARRAWPFRRLRRPFRGRNADAADPRSGERISRCAGRPGIQGAVRRFARTLCRSPQPALFRRTPDRGTWRRASVVQARRAQPHRRAQDQQLHRADPARHAHGQDAHHCGNRRGPARRRHRHRLRALWPALRDLYGRDRRGAAGTQCVSHEAARRGGCSGDQRRRDAQGCHERGAARLGRQCP